MSHNIFFIRTPKCATTTIRLLESILDFQFLPVNSSNDSKEYDKVDYHPLVLEIFNNNNQEDLELYEIVKNNFLI